MKILFFTPTATASAIAGVSEQVVGALIEDDHRVTVVRCETPDELRQPGREFGHPIIDWTDDEAVNKAHAECDAAVFQIGDHYPFHAGAVHWLDVLSGLVCIHDFFLGNLYLGWHHATGRHDLHLVESLYGEQVSRRFFEAAARGGEAFVEFAAEGAPMTEWIGGMASGAIAHSGWGVPRLAAATPGHVAITPLPFVRPLPERREVRGRGEEDPLVLVTIGRANANKRLAQVIEAIGRGSLLRRLVRYRHVGFAEPSMERELGELARARGVDFTMVGHVDDAQLASALDEAHAASCLRYPALEGASASLLDALVVGLPTLVTDVGSYAELPADVVIKIPPDEEIPALTAALHLLVADPPKAALMGRAGQDWAYRNADPHRYARVLVDNLEDSMRIAPVLRAMRRATGLLSEWQADRTVVRDEEFWGPLGIFSAVLDSER